MQKIKNLLKSKCVEIFFLSIILIILACCLEFLGENYKMLKEQREILKKSIEKIIIIEREIVYMHPFGTIKDPYREDLHGVVECSCIRTIRSLGIELPFDTDAKDLQPNTDLAVDVIAIFRTKDYSHVGLVTEIKEDGFLIKEGNYVECRITERFIKFGDYRLIGFYKT